MMKARKALTFWIVLQITMFIKHLHTELQTAVYYFIELVDLVLLNG